MEKSIMSELTLYALLIGVDCYEPNHLYKDLRGCVRDIDLVADYLQKTLLPSENIWKLTSPLAEASILSDIRAVRSEKKPTYENIVTAFAEITATAQSGEQVYIHYSGHGGRAATLYPELEGKKQDEGIVPMDIGSSGGRYLRDVEIATLLKRLTDKGCIVTVIFDSCHSGGATRGDCAVRGSESHQLDAAPRSRDSLVASRDQLVKNWRTLTQADPVSAGWLPNADDYVFLAACRPSEYAYEYAVNGSQRNGALTYWIVDTLTSSTSVLTYQSLYHRVMGMIQSKFPQQLPMLIGRGDRLVFGDQRQYKPYTVVVLDVSDDQQITLNAGLAAGLSSGTRFAIYPVDKDVCDRTQQIAIAELTKDIRGDRSSAKILSAEEDELEARGKIEPGASAVMVAAPIDLIRRVRLFEHKRQGDAENQLPLGLVHQQTEALEKVRQALAGNGWVVAAQDGEEADYQVAVRRNGEYEICIGMPVDNLRPLLRIDDAEAPRKVVERLVHLSKYQSVQALDNPASELTHYLEFKLCDKNKFPFPDPQNVSLTTGEITYLKIKNTYAQTLNVAVLDLEPTWGISQVPIQGDLSPFFPLESGQETYTKLRLSLPAEYQKTKETLKIFATPGLANFQWLILPPLDELIKVRRRNLNTELTSRARNRAIDPLNELLTAIGSDLNNPPEKTRAMVYEPDAEWSTQEINIRVQ